MKKFFPIILPVLFILVSCSDKEDKDKAGGMSSRAEKNIATVDSVSKAINSGNFENIDKFLATDIVDYAAEGGPAKGIDSVKAALVKMAAGMSDAKSEVIKALADDDYAMVWMKFTGMSQMDGYGMKKGEKYEMTALEVARFNTDGKCVEHWTFMEPREMMKMMGGNMPMEPSKTDMKEKKDTAGNK